MAVGVDEDELEMGVSGDWKRLAAFSIERANSSSISAFAIVAPIGDVNDVCCSGYAGVDMRGDNCDGCP